MRSVMTVREAAVWLGIRAAILEEGLQRGQYPFAAAVRLATGRWMYHVSTQEFVCFLAAQKGKNKAAFGTRLLCGGF